MALRSWAARTLSSFSGCEDSDGGERSKALKAGKRGEDINGADEKSEILSKATTEATMLSTIENVGGGTLLDV